MRRLVVLFVLALLGATMYGLSSSSSGVIVNGQHLSASTVRSELSVISHNNNLQCFVTALDQVSFAPGAGGYAIKASGAAAWANLRVEGLAIDQYVATKLKFVSDAAQLAAARSALEGELTQAATTSQLNCPGTSSEALAAMPPEMRAAEVEAQAASLYLVQKLKSAIPLTIASMKSYYTQHASDYDRLCVSAAFVLPSDQAAFATAQAAGASVATLATQYSQDTVSAAKGGALGCFSPKDSTYVDVRTDVRGVLATTTLNAFPTTPEPISDNGSTYDLYLAVTKESVTPFASAAATVLADLKSLNASRANTVKNKVLYAAAIHVDPAFGRWGLGTTGLGVFTPALPPTSDVTDAKQLTTTGSASYK